MEVVLVDNGSYLFELVGFGFSIGAGLDVIISGIFSCQATIWEPPVCLN